MALIAGTISSAFGALSNAAMALDRSDGCIVHLLLGEEGRGEGKRDPTTMKKCARFEIFSKVFRRASVVVSRKRPTVNSRRT